MAKAKPRAKSRKRKAKKKAASGTTAVVFTRKSGAPLGTVALTGATARLHESPQRIRKLMELLDLPKGTNAKVFTKASTVIIR